MRLSIPRSGMTIDVPVMLRARTRETDDRAGCGFPEDGGAQL